MVYQNGPLVKWPKTPASHAGNSGSNPLRVTKRNKTEESVLYMEQTAQAGCEVGVNDDEGPPVPIPNTVVKLIRAEDTWRAAAREPVEIFLNSSVGRACGC